MYLIVDTDARRIIAAGDGPIPPEPWPGTWEAIQRDGLLVDLYAEAARFGAALDLDDILVDAAGHVTAVSRNRPVPVGVQARLDWAASLLAGKSAAEIDALIDAQVTTVAGARALLKIVAKAVVILARERGLI